MKCIKCGREAYKSTSTEAIEMESGILVIRNIPCYECDECDEVLYIGDTVMIIEKITERAKTIPQEVAIVDYTKVA